MNGASKGSVYKWTLVLKNGGRETMNMPYLSGSEPNEEDIKSFLENFRPYIYSQLVELPGIQTITCEFICDYDG